MGQVRKIDNEYYIEFYARGLLYQQKAGEDYDKALRMLQEIESKIKMGEMGTVVRDVDLDIFLNTFLEFAKTEHAGRSLSRYEATIDHFSSFVRLKFPVVKKISEITPYVIEEYRVYLIRAKEKIRPTIINFTLLLLKDILDYAIKLAYLNDNPALHARWVEEASLNKRCVVSKEQIEKKIAQLREDKIKNFIVLEKKVVDILKQTFPSVEETHLIDGSKVDVRLWMVTRSAVAVELLQRGVSLIQLYKLLKLRDILKVMRYFDDWPKRALV